MDTSRGTGQGCGRKLDSGATCDAVLIPVTISYSMICGRIYAYQRGQSAAFAFSVFYSPYLGVNASIDSPYVSGLSLTHGLAEQRKHVWTFAGAYDETLRGYYALDEITREFYYDYNNTILPHFSCPCINPALPWPYEVPSYVGDSYFCDTGTHTFTENYNNVFMDNPLWDGEGCGGSSTCCSLNSPPWFCQHLKYHTSDDLELRLCSFEHSCCEDKLVSLVEIYVKLIYMN